MSKRDIDARIFNFACRIMKMDRSLLRDRRVPRHAMNQLVDAATSVGSNLEEARGAQSKADFHSKLRISLKEAREAYYWLRLLLKSEAVRASRIKPLVDEANEIVAILTTIAKKSNPKNPPTPPIS